MAAEARETILPKEITAPWSVVAKALGPEAERHYQDNPVAWVMGKVNDVIQGGGGKLQESTGIPSEYVGALADQVMGSLGFKAAKLGVTKAAVARLEKAAGVPEAEGMGGFGPPGRPEAKVDLTTPPPVNPLDLTDREPTKAELKAHKEAVKARETAVDELVVDKKKLAAIFPIAKAKGAAAEAALVQSIFDQVKKPVRRTQLEGMPDTTPVEGYIPDAIEKLRVGTLLSKDEAAAVKTLSVDAAAGEIKAPDGTPVLTKGKADPALLGVLSVMGVSALAIPHLMDWWNSPGGVSGDNSGEFAALTAGVFGAAMLKGKGKFDGDAALLKGFRDPATRESAATQIFQDTQPQLLRSIRNISKDVDAEDVAQRTYEKVFRFLAKPEGAADAFRGDAKISTLLHTVAANEIKNQWRGEKARPRTQSMEVDPTTGETLIPEGAMMEQSPERYQSTQDVVAQRRLADAMQGAIEKLSPERRAVFEAYELEGLSEAEIAQQFDIPQGTVKSRLSRAREDLQHSLRGYKDLQAGRASPEDLAKVGLVAAGAVVGTVYADDPVKGAIVGGLMALGGVGLATHPVDRALGRGTTRLAHVLPELRRSARDMEHAAAVEVSAASEAISSFIKPAGKLDKTQYAALDRAYAEADPHAMAAAIKGHPALVEGYRRTREYLKKIETELVAVGRFKEGLPDYLPLMVKDYKGLMESLGRTVKEGLEKRLHEANLKSHRKFGRPLSEAEQALIVNDYLLSEPSTSYQPGYAKSRRLIMTDQNRPFYHTMEDALIHYAHAAVADVAATRFFGQDVKTIKVKGKEYTNIEGSIGALTARAIKEGRITPEQAVEVQQVLRARFTGGQQSPAPWLQDVRNVTGSALLSQIGSGLVQTSEGLLSAYHHGIRPAVEAAGMVLTRRGIKPGEFGLANHVIEEVVGSRPTGKVLSGLLKVNLLAAFDQMGMTQNLTASFIKNKRLAQSAAGQAKLMEKWGADYGPDLPRLISELQQSTRTARTPLVDSLLYQELSDVRPTSRMEAPELFNAHPNTRLAYHLKQFMLTQADILRRDSYDKIRTGDPKQVAVGLKNLALYAGALSLVTIPSDAIKDWVMGRGLRLDKIDYVDNFVRNFGLSRYTLDKVTQSRTPGKAMGEVALNMITPPALSTVLKVGEGLSDPKQLVPFIPLAGRAIYNRELGGNEKAAAVEAKKERLAKRDAMEKEYPQLKAARLARLAEAAARKAAKKARP